MGRVAGQRRNNIVTSFSLASGEVRRVVNLPLPPFQTLHTHMQVVKGMLGTNTHLEASIEEVLSTHGVSLYKTT